MKISSLEHSPTKIGRKNLWHKWSICPVGINIKNARNYYLICKRILLLWSSQMMPHEMPFWEKGGNEWAFFLTLILILDNCHKCFKTFCNMLPKLCIGSKSNVIWTVFAPFWCHFTSNVIFQIRKNNGLLLRFFPGW